MFAPVFYVINTVILCVWFIKNVQKQFKKLNYNWRNLKTNINI